MIGLRLVLRFAHINWVLLHYGLDELILGAPWLRPFRFLRYLRPWALLQMRREPAPIRARKALEDLGPIFVKLGQMLSTRGDFLPPAYGEEFAKLQDQVPPFPGRIARRKLEALYGCKLDELFAEFDETPLASASIAQVHAARLTSGERVVIKVLRPKITRTIEADLSLMYLFAKLAERYLGDPRTEPGSYEITDLSADVARPSPDRPARPLMLIHGLADDNVVAAHTLRLSRALLEVGYPHTVLPLSGVTHMTPQEEVAENLLLLQLGFLRDALR